MNKNMKNIMAALLIGILSIGSFSSCEDMLTIDSKRYVLVENNTLSSANDSVQSVLGILRQLQDVAERYVLLGEMRADLLDVTEYTGAAIRELSDYTVSDTGSYANPRDYYAIINNCNYFISRTAAAGSPLKNENALIHAIRAWTYMQVGFNWGKAYYITEPLLTVNDTQKNFPEYDIPHLVDALIADLEPFAEAQYPNYGNVYNFSSEQLFFPVKVLLGDLYLWRGGSTADYEMAAKYYAEYLDRKFTQAGNYQAVYWSYENFERQNFDTDRPFDSWTPITVASNTNRELITAIQMAVISAEGKTCTLKNLPTSFAISQPLTELWDAQSYVLHYIPDNGGVAVDYFTTGDCRKYANIAGEILIEAGNEKILFPVLSKILNAEHLMLYRLGLIWLRYAEALNRAGKPQTAFAVLKYGLNPATFTLLNLMAPGELADNKPYITVFNNPKYENQRGIHAHGCGDSFYDTNYRIANNTSLNDTILNVERLICDELAMETSFEGNRMQDLIRMARRRGDTNFLAERIAAKHRESGDYNRIYTLLQDEKNWFLPEPKKE